MAEPKGLLITPLGFRADGTLHALELDNSDRLKVLIDALTGNLNVNIAASGITVPVAEQSWIYKRGVAVADAVDDVNLAAGANTLNGNVVPVGKKYVLRHMSSRYIGTVAGVMLIHRVDIGGIAYQLWSESPVVSNVFYGRALDIPLAAGERVSLSITGATLNDDGYLRAIYEDIT